MCEVWRGLSSVGRLGLGTLKHGLRGAVGGWKEHRPCWVTEEPMNEDLQSGSVCKSSREQIDLRERLVMTGLGTPGAAMWRLGSHRVGAQGTLGCL